MGADEALEELLSGIPERPALPQELKFPLPLLEAREPQTDRSDSGAEDGEVQPDLIADEDAAIGEAYDKRRPNMREWPLEGHRAPRVQWGVDAHRAAALSREDEVAAVA